MKSRATLQQVHVVITHHSPSVGNGRMHGLASRSTAVFEQLCRRHEIAVLLTGHDHTFAITRRENLPVEVRASTATQRNRWPQKQIRQFWLHRIQDQGTVLDWKATSWIYDLRRFVEVGPLNQVYTKQISRL
jgi:3',5'-cyclic AMP phosphodiesterase CpdA